MPIVLFIAGALFGAALALHPQTRPIPRENASSQARALFIAAAVAAVVAFWMWVGQ